MPSRRHLLAGLAVAPLAALAPATKERPFVWDGEMWDAAAPLRPIITHGQAITNIQNIMKIHMESHIDDTSFFVLHAPWDPEWSEFLGSLADSTHTVLMVKRDGYSTETRAYTDRGETWINFSDTSGSWSRLS